MLVVVDGSRQLGKLPAEHRLIEFLGLAQVISRNFRPTNTGRYLRDLRFSSPVEVGGSCHMPLAICYQLARKVAVEKERNRQGLLLMRSFWRNKPAPLTVVGYASASTGMNAVLISCSGAADA